MKKLILILSILSTLACKAQNVVLPLDDTPDGYGYANGEYYKDTTNDLDRFEGTWKYMNTNDTLTIVLQKKENQHIYSVPANFDYYEDIIVGEYKYIENGVEKINTLPDLQINYDDPRKYGIHGNIIQKPNPNVPSYCIGCNPGEVRIITFFSQPNREIRGSSPRMYIRHFIENGVEKLDIDFEEFGRPYSEVGVTQLYQSYTVPYGEYILVKQP